MKPEPMPYTTIKIQMDTRDELTEMGKKSESYDTIIKRLIKGWKNLTPSQQTAIMDMYRNF